MSDGLSWNAATIAEFRANEGRVGGNFEGAPMVLVHHRGRKSGREYVNPMMYLPHDTEPDIIYVFATKAGAPTNPDWYHNLTAAGDGTVERGTETYKVTVRELTGAERDRDLRARLVGGVHRLRVVGLVDEELRRAGELDVLLALGVGVPHRLVGGVDDEIAVVLYLGADHVLAVGPGRPDRVAARCQHKVPVVLQRQGIGPVA